MRIERWIIGVAVLAMAPLALAQSQGSGPSTELSIGENTKLSAGGLVTFGYTGSYADASPSSHGLTWGLDGKLTGYYYNPKFISFTASPYYNQSRANSSYQSLTGASGVDGSADFFSGSHFPGSVSYHYDRNSTGSFGLTGQPNFTTIGKGQGFGVNWSALLPKLPTLSVGYSQGEGSGTIYGTDQETNSSTRLFNIRSAYDIAGFRLDAFFNRQSTNSEFPAISFRTTKFHSGFKRTRCWIRRPALSAVQWIAIRQLRPRIVHQRRILKCRAAIVCIHLHRRYRVGWRDFSSDAETFIERHAELHQQSKRIPGAEP